jgi:hypothetical protein
MSASTDSARSANYADGFVTVQLENGGQFSFPVAENPRLAKATPEQLSHIEYSPFGIHWPDLDEDLSYAGLAMGDFGQRKKR